MIKELHEHDRRFAVLKEHVGLTAARPVGEPIDVGGISPGAVNQKCVDSFLVHQRLNGPVPPCHLLIGKRRIVGSLPHASFLLRISRDFERDNPRKDRCTSHGSSTTEISGESTAEVSLRSSSKI